MDEEITFTSEFHKKQPVVEWYDGGVDGTRFQVPSKTFFYDVYKITVSGPKPTLEGWNFLGKIEHRKMKDGSYMNMIKGVGEADTKDIPVKYGKSSSYCDHCKTDRYRKETMIVEKDGKYLQIGRNCLKDYFAYNKSPEELANFIAKLSDLLFRPFDPDSIGYDPDSEDEGFFSLCSGGEITICISHFLRGCAYSYVRNNGWISRQTGNDGWLVATKGGCEYEENNDPRSFPRLIPAVITEEMDALAKDTYEWGEKNIPERAEKNPYYHNLMAAWGAGYVKCSDIGLVSSIFRARERWLETAKSRAEQEAKWKAEKAAREKDPSEYIGDIKKREDFIFKVNKIIECESQFGISWLHIMVEGGKNKVIWFCSSSRGRLKEGGEYSVAATPKVHEEKEFRGETEKQTRVVRVKVKEIIKEAEVA